MPYISKSDRDYLKKNIEDICQTIEQFDRSRIDGIINYVISRIVARTYNNFNDKSGEWRYIWMSNVIKAFECAKLEFYRRIGAKQEDVAIQKNGDIEEYSL